MSSEATMKRLFRRGGMLLVTLEVMPGIGHFPQLEDPDLGIGAAAPMVQAEFRLNKPGSCGE